ncbi:hypothetical protein MATL_G00192250 [Megalops atlanticus]|uniref:Uncharacterized protein n=1 Tax=Megalops atlanticus TaxID=7932 RepID=A0A9D3PMY1_MEGAT|nr:hypothetical protein MATL_G00192250 [Megalops atlanticus]
MVYDDIKVYQGIRVCKYDSDSLVCLPAPGARLEALIKGEVSSLRHVAVIVSGADGFMTAGTGNVPDNLKLISAVTG